MLFRIRYDLLNDIKFESAFILDEIKNEIFFLQLSNVVNKMKDDYNSGSTYGRALKEFDSSIQNTTNKFKETYFRNAKKLILLSQEQILEAVDTHIYIN